MAIISGTYQAPFDRSAVYVTRSGTRLLAYAETPGTAIGGTTTRTVTQAILFAGRATGSGFSGSWAHLPKGAARSGGGFVVRSAARSGMFPGIAISFLGQPPMRSTEWRPGGAPAASRVDAAIQPGHFTALNMSSDLTGTWISEDGSYAYLRQLGTDVFWYAERAKPDGSPLTSFALHGKRAGTEFAAVSMTLPERAGLPLASQDVRIRIESPWELRVATRSGAQSTWWRVEGLWIDAGIGQVMLARDNDTKKAKEAPMFWSVSLKADGATQTPPGHPSARASIALAHKPRRVTELPAVTHEIWEESQGFQITFFPFGVAFKDNYDGKTADLTPSMGRHKTVLLTLPGLNPRSGAARRRAQFAILFVALEHDSTAWNTLDTARRIWLRRITSRIASWSQTHHTDAAGLLQDRLLQQLSAFSPRIVDVIRRYDHALTNSDDLVGTQSAAFSWYMFDPYPDDGVPGPLFQPSRQSSFQFRFTDGSALYVADGTAISSGAAERVDLRNSRSFVRAPKRTLPQFSVIGKGQLSGVGYIGKYKP